MATAEEIVDRFIEAIGRKDVDAALALVADDLEYDNVPMPTIHGRDATRDFLAPMVDAFEVIEWVVHRQVASGDTVFNERTDRFLNGGKGIELPVVGVWVVRDDRISLWRDYFDMQTFTNQMAPG